jgi:hypothetical protein
MISNAVTPSLSLVLSPLELTTKLKVDNTIRVLLAKVLGNVNWNISCRGNMIGRTRSEEEGVD